MTERLDSSAHIYVDGDLWGTTHEPNMVMQALRLARSAGDIHVHTSIAWDRSGSTRASGAALERDPTLRHGGAHSEADVHPQHRRDVPDVGGSCPGVGGGRAVRLHAPALAIVEPSARVRGAGYIGAAESDTLMLAIRARDVRKRRGINIRHTHCELHPSLMLGVLAAVIPFPDHNQSPRNTYQSAMSKQSMGLYATNFYQRFGTLGHLLYYPHRPLIQSRVHRILPARHMPSGQTVMVAIAVNGGWNQEDSVIVNRQAVQRGLFVSTMTKTYRSEERVVEGTVHRDRFCVPGASVTVGLKSGQYTKLDPATGVARVGESVRNGDILIGKVTPLAAKGSRRHIVEEYRDSSVVLRNSTGGIVDQTSVTDTTDRGRVARVRVRSVRELSIGDKVSSRHGQKGTVGMIRSQGDMPFTKDGVVPDIIMNPHAIPSRMTVGQLLEAALTKLAVLVGTAATPPPSRARPPCR